MDDDEFSDQTGDHVWVEFTGPSQFETAAPPTFYAVPADTMGELEPGRMVTLGVPGSHWLIDEVMILSGPYPDPDGPGYDVVPFAEFGAVTLRPQEQRDLTPPQIRFLPRRVPARHVWVYRPDTARRDRSDIPDWNPLHWYATPAGDLQTPPPARQPRPARELPSLSGQRLIYLNDDQAWQTRVAVCEPFDRDGELVTRLVVVAEYARACYGAALTDVVVVPLFRLWAY